MEEEKISKDQHLNKEDSKTAKKEKTEHSLVVAEHCKNCATPLALDQRFCPGCGAKRIYNRLTARNLLEDFSDRFLNIENTFLKTFIALWKKPDDVINGYIHGLRKKYMSAFGYFTIAITLGSIYIFIFRNWYMDSIGTMGDIFNGGYTIGGGAGNVDPDQKIVAGMTSLIDKILDYNSVFSFLYIPFYAVVSKIVFWNYKQVNFIEHIVIYLYAYSHTSIISSFLMILFGWSPAGSLVVSVLVSTLPFFYTAYVLYKVFDLDIPALLLKTLLFLIISFPLTLLFFGIIGVVVYSLGFVDPVIEGFREQVDIQKAANAARQVQDSLSRDSLRMVNENLKDSISSLKILKDSLR